MKIKKPLGLLAVTMAIALSAGCSDHDGKEYKQTIQTAISKQVDITSYEFAGSGNLSQVTSLLSHDTLTQSMFGLFAGDKLEWEGKATLNPVRMEMTVSPVSNPSGNPVSWPMLLKDNKLYMQLPMMNTKDYFMVDLGELSTITGQTSPLSADSIRQISQTLSESLGLAIADIEPKWFEQTEIQLGDGSKARQIRIDIQEKNSAELSKAIGGQLPEIADRLLAGGLIDPDQAAKWKQDSAGFSLRAPGFVAFAIDDAGFIRQQTIELTYSMGGKDHTITFSQNFDRINEEPAFSDVEPENVHSLTDLLKLIPSLPSR